MRNLFEKLMSGDGRALTVKSIAQLYRECACLAVPVKGTIQRIGQVSHSVEAQYESIDCDKLDKVKNSKLYSLQSNNQNIEIVQQVSRLIPDAGTITATSENGLYTAILRFHAKDNSNQLLEIFDKDKHLKTLDVSESETHGQINIDPVFGSISWCRYGEQDKLLYVCQAKQPKYTSFFKDPSQSGSTSDQPCTDAAVGEESIRKTHWGECLTGVEHTILAILDIGDNLSVSTIEVEGQSLASPIWLDDGRKIGFVAYPEWPRKLGVVYYNSHPSKIMVHDWRAKTLSFELSDENTSYHNPRANNRGDKFLYLSNPTYGPHFRSVSVNLCDVAGSCATRPEQITSCCLLKEQFIKSLIPRPFTSDDSKIIFTKSSYITESLYAYDIKGAKLHELDFPCKSVSLLDLYDDILLAKGSDVNSGPTLYVTRLPPGEIREKYIWHQLEEPARFDEIEYEIFEIPSEDQSQSLSALLSKPNLSKLKENYQNQESVVSSISESNLPTIVIVHGGPHSQYVVDFNLPQVFYTRLGFKTLTVNYRGSTGVSEQYNEFLCGKIGQTDTQDILCTIKYFVERSLIDPGKLVISGGSHGGFIAGNLSCQEYFKFTSAIIRNPVIDLIGSFSTTDIPDWCLTESLGHMHFDHSYVPSSEELVRMFECSPLSKSHKASVPTLMLLGSEDQRVRMFQGERWHEILKARGVETMCKIYPDGHALSKPGTQADCQITIALWMLKHLQH